MRSSPASAASQIKTQSSPQAGVANKSFPLFSIAVFLHIGLAILLYIFKPDLPTIYAFAVLAIGLATLLQKSPVPLIYVCAYIAGAELVWRMTKADVFWEMGKYAMILFMGLGILRWRMKLYGLGIIYFLLLTPGIILSLDTLPLAVAQDQISFDLSGPLCLAVAANFLHNVTLNRKQVSRLLLISLLPIISVSTLALRSTLTSNVIFIPESNFTTSGGFGPNQVSAVLGLGGLLGWLYLFIAHHAPRARLWFVAILSSLLVLQAVLTLSRGGIANLAIAIPCTTYFLLQGSRNYRRVLVLVLFMAMIFTYALPRLDAWTGGVINVRYNDLDTTGRQQLVEEDFRIWRENPFFGVGVGVSPLKRNTYSLPNVASHTEYSRLLSEHGIFGILSLFMLLLMALTNLRRAKGKLSQGLLVGTVAWSLAELSHAAMRIAAISFFFVLPLAALNLEDENPT
jgi:O-antigen ligase